MSSAYERVCERLALVTGYDPGGNGNRSYRCPAHPDQKPSLSVTQADDRVLIKCQAGCDLDAVLAALDLKAADLFDEAPSRSQARTIVATYDYTDSAGQLLFQKVRYRPKAFTQRRPDGSGGWIYNLRGVAQPLYRLPELLHGLAKGCTVFVVEGEKDADALVRSGEIATTNPGGAGKWKPEYNEVLRGADVVLVADRDEPGYNHARQVARSLDGVAAQVRVVQAKTGKDAADHLAARHSIDELELIDIDELGRLCGHPNADNRTSGPDGQQSPDDERRDLIRLALINSSHRIVDGATFLLDGGPQIAPLWGDGERCLWAEGEGLIIAGPEGVGKTTVAEQLTLARCGIGPAELLGFAVVPEERKVLYVAADRPSQARRSLLRMVGNADRGDLADKLVVWRGPLPFDLVKQPELLLVLAEHVGAGSVILDSLKDVAMDLSKDETGSRLNAAFQLALAEGVQVVGLHHQRKAQAGAPKPKGIADVYGSRWITAGAGSVFMIWGDPGDAVVELIHLKQPLEDVGPLLIRHDHHTGVSTVVDHVDVYKVVQESHKGITAQAVAIVVYKTVTPTRNQLEKARRRLDQLAREKRIYKREGARGGGDDRTPNLYFPLAPERP